MKFKPLHADLADILRNHGLEKKWLKTRRLFEQDLRHPSLNTELLQPHWRGIYSFRIDQRYRALFFVSDGAAEVFAITKHYRK